VARDDDYDRDDRPRGGPGEARRRVSTPAWMLILIGGLCLLLEIASLVVTFTNPTAVIDLQQKYLIDPMPAGADRDNLQKQLDDQKEQSRLDSPLNLGSTAVATVLNLLALIGGIKMRGLSGYGLAMTGAIAAVIPLSGCCCLTTPVGIWAIVVLLNPVVKEGFGQRKAAPADDYDDRDGERR
jgi:hypothetical protein